MKSLKAADAFMKACNDYLDDQSKKLAEEVKSGTTSAEKVMERFNKTKIANDLLDIGSAIRIGTWQAIASRDPKLFTEGQKKFNDVYPLLDSLKATEGFRAEPYTCPGGQRTIGYGHAIHRGDPLRVTPDQADSILRLDLNNCIERAYQLTRLKGNQLLAVASLLFGIREQSFLSSRMARKIRAGLPVDSSNWTSFNKVNGKRNRHVENFRKYQWRVYSQSF